MRGLVEWREGRRKRREARLSQRENAIRAQRVELESDARVRHALAVAEESLERPLLEMNLSPARVVVALARQLSSDERIVLMAEARLNFGSLTKGSHLGLAAITADDLVFVEAGFVTDRLFVERVPRRDIKQIELSGITNRKIDVRTGSQRMFLDGFRPSAAAMRFAELLKPT